MESPLRLLPLECTQAHSHHEQNKIQTVTVNLTQCDCLYPCPFHITSLFHALHFTVQVIRPIKLCTVLFEVLSQVNGAAVLGCPHQGGRARTDFSLAWLEAA
jgi:hypothetical protein